MKERGPGKDDDNFRRDMETFADEIEDKKPFVTPEELKVQETYKKLKEEDERVYPKQNS